MSANLSHESRVVFALASRLLQYPDAELLAQIDDLEEAAAALDHRLKDKFAAIFDELRSRPLLQSQQIYVETFDLRRKCCLYLSYYLNGDTRRRGFALWTFKNALATGGFEPASGELPDFLPTLLEFAAVDDGVTAIAVMLEHQQGIEVLQAALAERDSGYSGVLEAVRAALPEPTAEVRAAAQALAANGPPVELVGLEPFFIPTPVVGVRP